MVRRIQHEGEKEEKERGDALCSLIKGMRALEACFFWLNSSAEYFFPNISLLFWF